jgi:NAD(P)-dependent dehydrogenase (short-subunit alcohol dehydrogenase family)
MLRTSTPVWLITGCSTGLGRALAMSIVNRGWRAIVTARDISRVSDIVKMGKDRVLAIALDVTHADQIKAVVATAREKFGRIDVLVNNAGYGYQSAVERGGRNPRTV